MATLAPGAEGDAAANGAKDAAAAAPHERLFRQSSDIKAKREAIAAEAERKRAEAELEGATFKPNTGRTPDKNGWKRLAASGELKKLVKQESPTSTWDAVLPAVTPTPAPAPPKRTGSIRNADAASSGHVKRMRAVRVNRHVEEAENNKPAFEIARQGFLRLKSERMARAWNSWFENWEKVTGGRRVIKHMMNGRLSKGWNAWVEETALQT